MEAIPMSTDFFKGTFREHAEDWYTGCTYSMKDLPPAALISNRNRTLWKKPFRKQVALNLTAARNIKISNDLTFSTSKICCTATTAYTYGRFPEFRTVNDTEDNVESVRTTEATLTDEPTFHLINSVTYSIKDTDNKHFVLQRSGDNVQLIGKQLQGDNIKLAEKIEIDQFISRPVPANKIPVALSLLGRNLYLCCKEKELHLKEVSNIKDLNQKDLKPFIFLKAQNSAESTVTFESADAPGYYISTATKEETVKLSESESRIKHFQLFGI
ncbi:interleukin-1 beta-like [Xenopus tropicalis]|uniref:Interleukin-1 n=1 Tax=Xenopus tropicalis TaxID=8364 RepID=A0A803JB69_XENTR|nr:interleukin-1 beta-like [Xenopus tropicalis]XP_031755145.1 interleukin-1 beta-like [Xenopus tropicalis]